MAVKSNKIVKDAYTKYKYLEGDAEIKRVEEMRLIQTLDENSAIERATKDGIDKGIEKGIEQGIEKGIEQGIEKGIEQGIEKGVELNQINILKNMFKNNIDIKTMIAITNLSEVEILKIKKENNL